MHLFWALNPLDSAPNNVTLSLLELDAVQTEECAHSEHWQRHEESETESEARAEANKTNARR